MPCAILLRAKLNIGCEYLLEVPKWYYADVDAAGIRAP